MKRLVPTVALVLIVGATQTGCPFTAAGALIGLISGAVSDDRAMDMDDHVRNGALIGLEIDAAVFCGISTGYTCSRGRDEGGPAYGLARVEAATGEREHNAAPSTVVIVGPTSCVLACRF